MFSHLDHKGHARMVNVACKSDSQRTAVAQTRVSFSQTAFEHIRNNTVPKGDVFATARIAGIQGAKQCATLIPLCHPLPLSSVTIEFERDDATQTIVINATCTVTGKTGVEMEALTAASVAALTIYDMCKALDKGLVIGPTRLLEKHGGQSGSWKLEQSS